jgi:hypothetical protein
MPSNTSSLVTDARSDCLRSTSLAVNPGVSVGTTKPRTRSSSQRAQTTATSAMPPFVIHIFDPSMIQSSPPSRRARVRIAAGSEPESASVRPKQPTASPGRHARQPLLLLLLRPVGVDREHRERALHRHEAAQPRVARLELTARDAVGDRVHARAAVAVEVHAEQPEPAELERDLAHRELPSRTSHRARARSAPGPASRPVSRTWRSRRDSHRSGALMTNRPKMPEQAVGRLDISDARASLHGSLADSRTSEDGRMWTMARASRNDAGNWPLSHFGRVGTALWTASARLHAHPRRTVRDHATCRPWS